MHDKQRRRIITAGPQKSHRTLQGIDRRLQDQHRFPGHQPAGMITQDSRFNAVPGAPQPEQGCHGAGDGEGQDQHQGSGNVPDRMRLRPVHEQGGNPADSPGQAGSQSSPESTAPEEWIQGMDISVRTPVNQSDTLIALLCQLTRSFTSFILFCEVTDQYAYAHYLSCILCIVRMFCHLKDFT